MVDMIKKSLELGHYVNIEYPQFARNDNTDKKICCIIDLRAMKEGKK